MIRALAFATLVMGLAGCTADLYIGPDDATDGGSTGTTSGATTSSSTSVGTTMGESTTSTTQTTESTSESGTTESTTSTMTTGGSTGEDVSTSTGEPLICGELLFEACNAREDCLWEGEPDTGACDTNPCFTAAAEECTALEFNPCADAADCLWVGEMIGGECSLDVCAPCELQEPEVCTASPFCQYDEMEMACLPL